MTIRAPAGGAWDTSKDYLQLRRYMDALGVPGVLIDAHRILLVDLDGNRPPRDISRRSATGDDLDLIKRHLTDSSRSDQEPVSVL